MQTNVSKTNSILPMGDVEEVATHLCKIDEESDMEKIDSELFEKYGVSLEQFTKITKDLFSLMDFGVSPLTNTAFIGFLDRKQQMWLAKKPVDQQFIAGLLQWCTEGENIPENSNGFLREITTLKGKVEYEIVIRRPKKSK